MENHMPAPTGAEVWRDYVTNGVPASGKNSPKKSDIREWATSIEGQIVGAAAGIKSAKTWAELSAVVGSTTLQKGEVIDDAGTHTDPVVGGTVPNKGAYSWSTSPDGWKRTGDLIDMAVVTATQSEVHDARQASPSLLDNLNRRDNPAMSMLAEIAAGNRHDVESQASATRAAGNLQTVFASEMLSQQRWLGESANGGAATVADTPAVNTFALRETRSRLRSLLAGSTTEQVVVTIIGDSWSYGAWASYLTKTLQAKYGNAGHGYTSYIDPRSSVNAMASLMPGRYSVTLTGSWDAGVDHRYDAPSVSLGRIISGAVGDKVVAVSPATSSVDEAFLHYTATPGAEARYRWNSGSWTTIDLSVGTGVQRVSVSAGAPTVVDEAQSQTLEIEVTAGTVTLHGDDRRSNAAGVVVHRLGSSGSSLGAQWLAVDATQWQSILATMGSHLTVVFHGTNDRNNSSPDALAANYRTASNRILTASPATDLLWISPPENYLTDYAIPMADYTAAVRAAALEDRRAHLDLQPIWGLLADYRHDSIRPFMSSDMIHPSTRGNQMCADAVERLILNTL